MVPVYTAASPIQGTGCYAGRDIRKGELVAEYDGPRISEEEADEKYADTEATYLFMLEDGTVIDATHEPGPVKYINHSCSPNCEAREHRGRILIYALRAIKKDEELSYDYQLAADEDDSGLDCRCGAKGCRGTMRGER